MIFMKNYSGSWRGTLGDLRYGWRGLRRSPVFTAFAVLALGLGIGANTTVFTIVNTILLHPMPVADPSRLAALFTTGSKTASSEVARLPLSYANFNDLAGHQTSFRDIAAFTSPMAMTLRTDAGSQRMFGEFAGKGYFETLGLTPALGRFFAADENAHPGGAPVAVLSYNAWKARFGAAPAAIGSHIELNNIDFTIVGVAPPGFLGVSAIFGPDVWMPATMCERAFPAEFAGALTDRGKPLFHAVARLRPDSNLQRAQAELGTVAAALARDSRKTGRPAPLRSAEFLSRVAAREARPFALLRDSRKTGRSAPLRSAECLSRMAAREARPFALLGGIFDLEAQRRLHP